MNELTDPARKPPLNLWSLVRWGAVSVLTLATAGAMMMGAGAASARANGPTVMERHEQSVQVLSAPADASAWRGSVVVNRSTRMGHAGQRPWQVTMRVERTVCDVVGCITTVLSTPADTAVLVSAHLGSKLSSARVRRSMVPVVVERFEGSQRVSRQVTVMGLTLRATATGSITANSLIRIEGTRHWASRHRWVVAQATALLTPMASASPTVEPIEIGGPEGRISVVRETVTNIAGR
jgi:hypothetical protein